jgi:hypothetical protein
MLLVLLQAVGPPVPKRKALFVLLDVHRFHKLNSGELQQ